MKNKRSLKLFFIYCFFIYFSSPAFSALKTSSDCHPSLFDPGYLEKIDQLNADRRTPPLKKKRRKKKSLQSAKVVQPLLNLNGSKFSSAPNQSPSPQQDKQIKVKNLSEIKPIQRLGRKRKEEVKAEFIQAFQRGDLLEMKALITEFPFLKNSPI